MIDQPTANIDAGQQHTPTTLRSDDAPPLQVLSIITEAESAYSSDLPQLLATHPGQWVAYHGSKQLALAPSKSKVYERLANQGIDPTELLVRRIRARAEEIVVPTYFLS